MFRLVDRLELAPKVIVPVPGVTAQPVLFQPAMRLMLALPPVTETPGASAMLLLATSVSVLGPVIAPLAVMLMSPVPP